MKKTWLFMESILMIQVITSPLNAGWVKVFDDGYISEGFSVNQTTDGGYIVGGETQKYTYGAYLLKTNSNGDESWNQYYEARLLDAQPTSDDGYILTGCMNSSIWLCKTNSSGGIEWEKFHHINDAFSMGYYVNETSDGGYIIAGELNGFPGLLKTDSKGDSLWACWLGGMGWSTDVAYCVRETSGGQYISVAAGSNYSYLHEISAHGILLWSEWLIGRAFSVTECPDGGSIITGTKPVDGWQVFIHKSNSSGDSLWQKTYSPGSSSVGNCINVTSDGGYIVVGTTAQNDSNKIWFARLYPNGDTIKTLTFNEGAVRNWGNYVQQTTDGGYVLTGSLGGNLCLIKIDAIQAITEQPPATYTTWQLLSTIGPQIEVQFENQTPATPLILSVLDAAGRKVDEIKTGQSSGTILWGQGYSPGVYFIRETASTAPAQKVILAR